MSPARPICVAIAASLLSGCFTCPQGDEPPLSPFLPFICASFAPAAKGSVDARAYDRALARVLPESTGGPELLAHLQAFHEEGAASMAADPALDALGHELARLWSGRVRVFVDGFGIEGRVTQEMADTLDAYLTRLASLGSPSLADAIAAERAKRPPLSSLVGLDMNAFRAVVLPLDRVFRDGFEQEQ